jgi:uncharacterized protein YprB with RNaseH-like and TPR domain
MLEHVYGLDIETDTTPMQDGTPRGLDPSTTSIINIALTVGDDVIVFRGEEKDLLISFDRYLAGLEPGLLATWNGSVFDLPFLQDRALLHGVELGLQLTVDRSIVPKYEFLTGHSSGYSAIWKSAREVPHEHLDIAYALRDMVTELGVSWSLKPVARHFGLSPVEVDRTAVHKLSAEEQDIYVASDARVTAVLTRRFLSANL